MEKLKNRSYLVSSFVFLLLFLLINNQNYFINLRYIGKIFFWLCIPVFIFSLITFFLKDGLYLSWRKFTNYFLIFSVLIILITPTSTHGLDFLPLVKETMTIALTIIYSIVSLILVIYKSFKTSI